MTISVRLAEPTINIRRAPYNARGDGVTDDTDAFLAAIDDMPSTGKTATFQAYKLITNEAVFASAKSVTIANAGQATQNLSVALLATDTDDFAPGIAYRYEVNSTAGLLVSGKLSARSA